MASAVQFEANRLKFGLFSTQNCVRPEETAEYTNLSKALWKDLNPVGPVEQMLAVEIVRAAWRLHRCAAAEAENGDNPATQAAVDRARASSHNSMRRLLNDLRQFQSDRWLRAEVLREGFNEAYIGIADAHRVIKGLRDNERLKAQLVGQAILSPANVGQASRPVDPQSTPTIRTQSAPAPHPSRDREGGPSLVAPAVSAAGAGPAPTIRTQSAPAPNPSRDREGAVLLVASTPSPVAPVVFAAGDRRASQPCQSPSPDPRLQAPDPAIPRNAPCPCHSGLKYKRCCGTAAPPVLTTDPRSLISGLRC